MYKEVKLEFKELTEEQEQLRKEIERRSEIDTKKCDGTHAGRKIR